MKSLVFPQSLPTGFGSVFHVLVVPDALWSSGRAIHMHVVPPLLLCLPAPMVTTLTQPSPPLIAVPSPLFSWWQLKFPLTLWYVFPLAVNAISLATSKDIPLLSWEKENIFHKHFNTFVRPQAKKNTCSHFACMYLEPLDSIPPQLFFFPVYHLHHFTVAQSHIHPFNVHFSVHTGVSHYAHF